VVERNDRPPLATFFAREIPESGAATLESASAHHARVKRLDAGDAIRLTNGRGTVADGRVESIGRDAMTVAVDRTWAVNPPPPIHLCVPIADRDRMLWIAEKATELGIASWRPVRFRRSMSVSPRGEGSAFATKVRARMLAALEQSGGAWLPEIHDDQALDALRVPIDALRVALDMTGAPLLSIAHMAGDAGTALLFGPEGGLDDAERAWLANAGWQTATLGAGTLRFETAAIAATAIVRAHHVARGEG
jgi:16S rRNA (uracil1498-N3)-methyltransferase